MNTAEVWWAEQNSTDLADVMARPVYVGSVAQSVKHIHALVRHGYHPKFVEAALAAHLAKHDLAVQS